MISLVSSPWRKFSAETFIALALVLNGCATTYDDSGGTKRARSTHSTYSNQFEWAVQHYEAGDYAKAIEKFEGLRKQGSAVPEYDLLSFYLGMSHFRLGHFPQAASELEAFTRASGNRQEGQEARVALLLTYEKLERWKELSGLAAETDKLTLFQYNRALLKLVWARALREQGELLGAKAVLQDSTPYLDKVGQDDRAIPYYADPDKDLWGRYFFTSVLLEEMECNRLGPKELSNSKKKKAKPRRLYSAWLESTVDCFRKSISSASEELFQRESPWSDPAVGSVGQGIQVFGKKIEGFLKDESGSLDQHRTLQKESREQLYRLLGTIDEHLKNFKNHGFNAKPLESLRKLVDRLLVSISVTS